MLTCRPFAVNRVRAIGAIAVADGYLNSFDRKFLNTLRNWDAVGNFQIYPSFNALVVGDDSVLGRPTKPRMSRFGIIPDRLEDFADSRLGTVAKAPVDATRSQLGRFARGILTWVTTSRPGSNPGVSFPLKNGLG